jgi:hypothetical protein
MCGDFGCGVVFELTPSQGGRWTETVLYTFCSRSKCLDGAFPSALIIDSKAGHIYGTTLAGGGASVGPNGCAGDHGCGVVFE